MGSYNYGKVDPGKDKELIRQLLAEGYEYALFALTKNGEFLHTLCKTKALADEAATELWRTSCDTLMTIVRKTEELLDG